MAVQTTPAAAPVGLAPLDLVRAMPATARVPVPAIVGPVTRIPVGALLPAESPRRNGVNPEHARVLAALGSDLPPILVNRATMRVIDGMHRLAAARLNGAEEIAVQFCDGTDDEAFVLAVTVNVACGLPLTLADRRAAAARILRAYPYLSDRSIAATACVAPNTVAAMRRATVQPAQSNRRLGRDGRWRPRDCADRRRAAGAVIARHPTTPLREVARQAGISVGTARDVRQRVRNGQDPVVSRDRATSPGRSATAPAVADPQQILAALRSDPSLRYQDSGRQLLRWLSARSLVVEEWRAVLTAVPPHCAGTLGQLARACAVAWSGFADQLELRGRGSGRSRAGVGPPPGSDQTPIER